MDNRLGARFSSSYLGKYLDAYLRENYLKSKEQKYRIKDLSLPHLKEGIEKSGPLTENNIQELLNDIKNYEVAPFFREERFINYVNTMTVNFIENIKKHDIKK